MSRDKKKAPEPANDRAPMCNICQPPRRHWGREGHKFEKQKKKTAELGTAQTTCMEYAPYGGWQRLSFQIRVF